VPDVLLAGKGLASGYPISLIASRRELLDHGAFGLPGAGASTFASGNLACAAGAATLALLEDGSILENARRVGETLFGALKEIQSRHPLVGDVRGRGMLMAMELVQDSATKAPIPPRVMRELLLALARRGLLAVGGGPILRITPPLVLSEELALRGAELLDDALEEIERAHSA
jgi:4-aminobutyrate aminotransferase-like enzyme